MERCTLTRKRDKGNRENEERRRIRASNTVNMKKRDKQRRNFISGETCVRVIAEMQTDSK